MNDPISNQFHKHRVVLALDGSTWPLDSYLD
jgi:hypothetical protein